MHANKIGARDNSFSMQINDDIETFPMILHGSGYQTAIVGKWHLNNKPKGFDYSSVLIEQGQYYNPDFITNSDTSCVHGYATDIIMDKAINWLSDKRDKGEPFCLMVHNKAPHRDWIPDTTDLKEFSKDLPLSATLYYDYSGGGLAARRSDD